MKNIMAELASILRANSVWHIQARRIEKEGMQLLYHS